MVYGVFVSTPLRPAVVLRSIQYLFKKRDVLCHSGTRTNHTAVECSRYHAHRTGFGRPVSYTRQWHPCSNLRPQGRGRKQGASPWVAGSKGGGKTVRLQLLREDQQRLVNIYLRMMDGAAVLRVCMVCSWLLRIFWFRLSRFLFQTFCRSLKQRMV